MAGFYGGYMGNAGAIANANPLLDPRFKIQGGEPWNRKPLLPNEKDPNENTPFQFLPPNPGQAVRLAQALPGAAGNMAGMAAASDAPQGYFPGPMGSHGLMMPMGPNEEQMKQQEILAKRNAERSAVLEAPVNYKKPLNLDINATPQGLESVGAGGTIVLDPNQRLRMGGTYTPGYTEQGVPISQGYKIEAGYETPGFGLNLNYRDSRGRIGGGFGGEMNLRGTW